MSLKNGVFMLFRISLFAFLFVCVTACPTDVPDPDPEPESEEAQEGEACDAEIQCVSRLECDEGICIEAGSGEGGVTEGNIEGSTEGTIADAGGSSDGELDGTLVVDAGESNESEVDAAVMTDSGTSDGAGDRVDAGDTETSLADGGMAEYMDAGNSVTCDAGYAVNEDSGDCESPCAAVDCIDHAACVVVDTQAVCLCVNGYEFENEACVDIDECTTNNGGCHENATCANGNNPGEAPACECNTGYSGDGSTCTDIDECATNNGGCEANATCTNNSGTPLLLVARVPRAHSRSCKMTVIIIAYLPVHQLVLETQMAMRVPMSGRATA
jgi:hypothetical protein